MAPISDSDIKPAGKRPNLVHRPRETRNSNMAGTATIRPAPPLFTPVTVARKPNTRTRIRSASPSRTMRPAPKGCISISETKAERSAYAQSAADRPVR